jgi:D-aminopeptidase
MPGVERVADRTVRFVHDDPVVAYRGFLALVRLVESVSG